MSTSIKTLAAKTSYVSGKLDRMGHDFLGEKLAITPGFLKLNFTVFTTHNYTGKSRSDTLTVGEWLNQMSVACDFHFGTLKSLFINPIIEDAKNGDEDDQTKAAAFAEKETARILKWHGLGDDKNNLSYRFYSVKGENLRPEDCKKFAFDDGQGQRELDLETRMNNGAAEYVVNMIEAWIGHDKRAVSSELSE